MATRNIKDAKDLTTGELVYFKSHAQATYMSDGRTVEEAISGGIGGGSSSEDIRYFTGCTVEGIIEACNENNTVVGQSYGELLNATTNNKLICVPYRDGDKGYEVASCVNEVDNIGLRLEYGGNVYTTYPGDDDTIIGAFPTNLIGDVIELFVNVNISIDVQDNTTYNLSVEGEFKELTVGLFNPLLKGSTIRFFSSHWVGINESTNAMIITFVGMEVLWPNGVMPEIEIDTWYELSLTSTADGHILAVLVPFKSVE